MVAVKEPKILIKDDQEFVMDFTGDLVSPLKAGDKVKTSTVIFEGSVSERLQSVDLCKELSIPASDAKEYLVLNDGEIVNKGDLLASRTMSLGMTERIVKADADGRLSYERLESGVIDVMSASTPSVINANLKGRVKFIMPERGNRRMVGFSITGHVVKPVVCAGPNSWGRIHLLREGGNSIYVPADIKSSCKGKVVVAGRILNIKLYEALVEAGAVGVIVGGVDYDEFNAIEEKAIPVFVMEGWGLTPLDSIFVDFMNENDGGLVYLDVENQKLVAYCEKVFDRAVEASDLENESFLVALEKGMEVEVWEFPYWGYSGVIGDILEDEELVKVKLGGGTEVLVSPLSVRVISDVLKDN